MVLDSSPRLISHKLHELGQVAQPSELQFPHHKMGMTIKPPSLNCLEECYP